jgi:hypothetical protein
MDATFRSTSSSRTASANIVRSVAWMIRTEFAARPRLGTLSQKTTHPSWRQGSQPNRAETRPDMHPHSVRVVRPRGRPKPCPRHGLQPVIGVRAHRPRLPRQWDPRRRLGQQNRQLLAGLGTRSPVYLSADSSAVRAKDIRGSRPAPILAKIDRALSVRAGAQDISQESVSRST